MSKKKTLDNIHPRHPLVKTLSESIFNELCCDPEIASQSAFYTFGLRPLHYITKNFFDGERIVIRKKDELIQTMGDMFWSKYAIECLECKY
jgi:ABC-type uncharacterized transport system auxiliary subunit